MNPAKTVKNAKLEQFKEEIKALEDRYQYQIAAIIVYTQNGILPRLSVTDIIPPKKEEAAAPKPSTDPAPSPEEPAKPVAKPAEPEVAEQ